MSSSLTTHVFRQATRFFSGTLMSRFSGMLRDITMAFLFGTDPALAAFMIAFRFVYLIRRLFGEGLLHQGFVPRFEQEKKLSPRRGAEFFRDLFWSFSLLLILVIFLIEIGLGMALHFHLFPGAGEEIIRLSMRILPGIFFICLFGLSSGFLHSENHFFLSSASGVLANVIWILGMLFLSRFPIDQAVTGLCVIVGLAFLVQWGSTLPKIYGNLRKSLHFKEIFQAKLFSEKLRTLKVPMFLGVVGVASVQINSAVDVVFARFADIEGPAYLWYAIRMQQLPLSLFGIALSSALLPSLSRAVSQSDNESFLSLMHFSMKRNFSIMFPCAIGIFVLGAASVNLLFGRGDFSNLATSQTSLCLFGYGLGLVPYTFVQIFAPAFYAKGDYKTPAMGFLSSALLNIGLNALLVFYWKLGVASVALATSVSAFFNAYFLYSKLYRGERKLWHRSIGLSMTKTMMAAMLAGFFVLILGYGFLKDPTLPLFLQNREVAFSRLFPIQFSHFAIQAGIYFVLFFSFCKIFRAEDALSLIKRDTYSSK